MRSISIGLILAVGLTATAQAQAPAPPPTAPAPPPATTAAPPPAATTPEAPPATTTPAPPAATPGVPGAAPPATTTPEAAPPAVAEAPPALPTTGNGAAIIQVLEKVCVPLVRGGNFDQLAAQLPGARKNRRDGTWTMPLGGERNYTLTLLVQGVNKDVCQAEVHYPIGGDDEIYKAINIWAYLHKPELIATANYVQTGADNVKRVQRSWEHLESGSSTAVNFTTWKKPDDSPLNRGYDTGYLFYQERKLS
ncbi:MAG TPA: hypothetical protein VHV27_07565 [Phenylobacterium sp.]|nr:hypothetical protein [Phenylobacterium sp.]